MSEINKAVLAYSGGLDTSVILKWLQDTYRCEVVTFTADLGQGEELGPARDKALLLGIKPENIFIEDVRDEWTRWTDAVLLTTATLPSYVERRLEAAFDQVIAEAKAHG